MLKKMMVSLWDNDRGIMGTLMHPRGNLSAAGSRTLVRVGCMEEFYLRSN